MNPDDFEPKELTNKQRRFAEEYVVDLSVKDAAARSGSAVESANRWMNQQNVRDYIQKLMDVRAEKTAISAEYVLSTIADTIERCREAKPILKLNKTTGEMEETGRYKFDAAAVLKGCELLGRHLVLFTDKVETKTETSVAEVDEKLQQLLAKYKD